MYGFDEVNDIAALGMRDIEAWLSTLPQTLKVRNVEADAHYQARDIDLLWFTRQRPGGYGVEVKVDRYHQTGNFFFETHSNLERNAPGCFMYTEAELLFYYFIASRHLYILPMPATRAWFLRTIDRYKVRDTTTPLGGGHYYTTRGRLVPRQQVMEAIAGARELVLPGG